MTELQIGDKVRGRWGDKEYVGVVQTITENILWVTPDGDPDRTLWIYRQPDGAWGENLEKIEEKQNKTIKTKIMNLIDSFKLSLKSEPEKTFRKAGITDGDDILTGEGTRLFLQYLLEKNKDGFKTDVVDKILAEQEK